MSNKENTNFKVDLKYAHGTHLKKKRRVDILIGQALFLRDVWLREQPTKI